MVIIFQFCGRTQEASPLIKFSFLFRNSLEKNVTWSKCEFLLIFENWALYSLSKSVFCPIISSHYVCQQYCQVFQQKI